MKLRTLKAKRIKEIFSEGNFIRDKNFTVLYQKNNLNFPRFAFVVSKKYSKKAVERNRAKRILREAIRLSFKENHSLESLNYDIVFLAKETLKKKKVQIW